MRHISHENVQFRFFLLFLQNMLHTFFAAKRPKINHWQFDVLSIQIMFRPNQHFSTDHI